MTMLRAREAAMTDATRRPGRPARALVLRRLAAFPCGSLRIEEPDGRMLEVGTGTPRGSLRVRDWSLYRRLAAGGATAAGEAWVEGLWETESLLEVIRYFAANVAAMEDMERGLASLGRPLQWLSLWLRRNSPGGARRNITAHYDLGNDFFRLFLDTQMQYSSAVFPTPEASLEQAQEHKMERLCRALTLEPEHHLLEIGTGWGGLALYAAGRFGCRVTTTTISRRQYEHARLLVREAGLEDRVTVLAEDYRDLHGTFDRIVSVEMIEAVGARYLPTYFRQLGRLLAPGGQLALQAITIDHRRYRQALHREDFIKRHVFPGGFLPSVPVLQTHLERNARLRSLALEDIGMDYARTLSHWRQRFMEAREEAAALAGMDERFLRLWEYYLTYCEGAFREGAISAVQLLAGGRHGPVAAFRT